MAKFNNLVNQLLMEANVPISYRLDDIPSDRDIETFRDGIKVFLKRSGNTRYYKQTDKQGRIIPHRVDGPAVIRKSPNLDYPAQEFWLNGVHYPEKEFWMQPEVLLFKRLKNNDFGDFQSGVNLLDI